jgi:hypothetical protein
VSASDPGWQRQVGLVTATFILVATMIGTGDFTSLGFQVVGILSAVALLALCALGVAGWSPVSYCGAHPKDAEESPGCRSFVGVSCRPWFL